MKKLFVFLYLILALSPVYPLLAQIDSALVKSDTSYWIAGGLSSLTFSQVSLTNWAAGGQNSVSINGYIGLFADLLKERHTWENSLDFAYGLMKQGEVDFIKSDDKLNFVTKYGYQIDSENKKWFFSGLLDFKTQFTSGFATIEQDSAISRFMAPGYLVLGIGVDYKPSKTLSINYIPFTGKFTFVMDDELSALGAYGVDPGSKARAELGSFFRVKYKDEIIKNVKLDSRLELFTNYLEKFGNIDVNWQNGFVFKVNGWLTTNFFTQLIYDDDIKIEVDNNEDGIIDETGPRVQFKSVLGVGLTFVVGDERKEE